MARVYGVTWRVVPIVLAMLVLGGCDELIGDARPGLGEPLADGSVLIGRGQTDGIAWIYTATRDRGQICMTLTLSGVQREPACQHVAGLGTSSSMSATRDGPFTIAEGLASEPVAYVRLETARGPLDVPVAPLAALGVSGGAYGVVIHEPEMSDLAENVFLDAGGNPLDRTRLPPIDLQPIE